MKARAKMLWNAMKPSAQRMALTYYCNPAHQVHHKCEHGGKDFDSKAKEYDRAESERGLKNR